MFRRIASMSGLVALAMLALSARPAAAQNQGYSVWAHRNGGGSGGSGGGGWRSRGFSVPRSPAYYDYAPAFTASAPVTPSQSYYYASNYFAPVGASPVNNTATINVTVPADAKIGFDGSMTVQSGSGTVDGRRGSTLRCWWRTSRAEPPENGGWPVTSSYIRIPAP